MAQMIAEERCIAPASHLFGCLKSANRLLVACDETIVRHATCAIVLAHPVGCRCVRTPRLSDRTDDLHVLRVRNSTSS